MWRHSALKMAALHCFQYYTIQTSVTFLFVIWFWSGLCQIAFQIHLLLMLLSPLTLTPFLFLSSAEFFKINFFEKFFQECYQSVKQFGSRSGPTFCQAWSGSKLFAKVISRRHLKESNLISMCLTYKPLLNHANCHKPDQNRIRNKEVREIWIY